MDIRYITPEYAVSPQIEPTDMALLAEQGFTMVINNRPDDEVPPTHQSEAMRAAAEAAGLTYVENPVVNGAMTMDMVTTQGQSITDASRYMMNVVATPTKADKAQPAVKWCTKAK